MTKENLFSEVQNQILESLKNGVTPWVKPFIGGIAKNIISDKEYTGCNAFILNFFTDYNNPYFGTYKQWTEKNRQVKKGEKSVKIAVPMIFKDDNGDIENIFFKTFSVFNYDQTEGEEVFIPIPLKIDIENELTYLNFNLKIDSKAAYNIKNDYVKMPESGMFNSTDSYYSTLFHELCHWTGHESRLNRDLKSFTESSTDYAMEELIAELGSAFLCKHFGIDSELNNSANYIGAWIKLLESDQNAFKKASQQAYKAFTYILDAIESNKQIKMAA
jgi:antirestriction protein ArdC